MTGGVDISGGGVLGRLFCMRSITGQVHYKMQEIKGGVEVSPIRILFASPYCLLDTTSGAAISIRDLLGKLARKGLTCEAVTASSFDPPRQVLLDAVIDHQRLSIITKPEIPESIPCVRVMDGDLTHTILRTARSQRQALNSREESALLSLIEGKISAFKPDIILTYGGLSVELSIHRLARAAKIPVVFFLANGLYTKAETFADVDLIIVPSGFLSEFYSRRLGIRSEVLRDIIREDRYFVENRNPRFITYINPAPQKGMTLFARLVGEALKEIPQAQFLVVEGRWTQADVARTGFRLDRIPNIKIITNQIDMRPVYAATKVLLFPSFWNEASGRTIGEAQLNGIPVMASRLGGIPENLNGGGFLFDIPERCTENHMAIPTAGEVRPWIDQLRLLLEDEEACEEAQGRALLAAAAFGSERIAQRAMDLFHRLLDGELFR